MKIGLLSDVAGPYRHVGGPGSRLTAEIAVVDFGGSVLGRPIEVMQGPDQNKDDAVAAKMRETPLNDFYNKDVRIQPNGCVPHTMYLWQVKEPRRASRNTTCSRSLQRCRRQRRFRPQRCSAARWCRADRYAASSNQKSSISPLRSGTNVVVTRVPIFSFSAAACGSVRSTPLK